MEQIGKTLAIITARGGSKGLHRKNILDLCGKPVIAYSIEAALESRHLDRVIVSTEDEEIAAISRQFGAEVPFIRPQELATDAATHISVLQHAIGHMETEKAYLADAIVLLQPTSPLRTAKDIDAAIELFRATAADSVVSVAPTIYLIEEYPDGTLHPIMESQVGDFHRHYPNRFFDLNGAIYVVRTTEIMEHNRMLGARTFPYIMEKKRSLEIDDKEDLEIISLILRTKGRNDESPDR